MPLGDKKKIIVRYRDINYVSKMFKPRFNDNSACQ